MSDREDFLNLKQRLSDIRTRIADAAAASGRDPQSITLVAVSKGHDVDAIRDAYALGLRDFGESYMQEWLRKKELLADLTELRWHFIGHLQTNKAKMLDASCYCLHSVDRLSILQALCKARRGFAGSQKLKVLLQLEVDPSDVNKFGANFEEAKGLAHTLAHSSELEWAGFMGMAPLDRTPDELDHLFRGFVRKGQLLWQEYFSENITTKPIFSLGMSDDLEQAIAAGSSLVRVGTALFGSRPRREV